MRKQIRRNLGGIALALGWAAAANAAALTVTNSNDSGPGSLREAIDMANANSEADTITFSINGTIALTTTLPAITTQMTIDGSGHNITLSGRGAVQVMFVDTAGALTLQYITVANGQFRHGGGISSLGGLTVRNCSFVNNAAGDDMFLLGFGGGIYSGGGTLTISDSTFSGNRATVSGGGVEIESAGAVTISGSTFSNNHALSGAGLSVLAETAISNSTISGNTADTSGAGIMNDATLTLKNVTISGNSGSSGTGIENDSGSILNIQNSIIANNSGGDCANFGTINAAAVNLVKDGSCAIPGALSGDPKLGTLADNGGPTQTHALLPGSPAIDAGNDTVCAASPVNNRDQRGENRPSGTHCDLGAFELQQTPPIPFTGFFQPVENPPVANIVKAGQAIPVKFSLGGNRGLDIFNPGYPATAPMNCTSGSPVSEIEVTTSAGGSSLAYDPASNTYAYTWKTDKAWAGMCRQFVIQLKDGTFHTASFQFK